MDYPWDFEERLTKTQWIEMVERKRLRPTQAEGVGVGVVLIFIWKGAPPSLDVIDLRRPSGCAWDAARPDRPERGRTGSGA